MNSCYLKTGIQRLTACKGSECIFISFLLKTPQNCQMYVSINKSSFLSNMDAQTFTIPLCFETSRLTFLLLCRLPKDSFKNIVNRLLQFISIRLYPPEPADLPPIGKCSWWIPSVAKILALLSKFLFCKTGL